uniref:Uncharacterized protein n=1 Tax=Arion vulgaris TaxID=1028688 RepID=A0A0B6ZQ00_9EUPU
MLKTTINMHIIQHLLEEIECLCVHIRVLRDQFNNYLHKLQTSVIVYCIFHKFIWSLSQIISPFLRDSNP